MINPAKSHRNKFSQQEDKMILKLVNLFGTDDWKFIAQQIPNRTSRQCRERWKYYLQPSSIESTSREWTEDEDALLIQKFKEYGSKWSKISVFFDSRSDVSLKNRYKKLQRMDVKKSKTQPSDNSSTSIDEEIQYKSRQFIELPAPLSVLFDIHNL